MKRILISPLLAALLVLGSAIAHAAEKATPAGQPAARPAVPPHPGAAKAPVPPGAPYPEGEADWQYEMLQHDLARRPFFKSYEGQVFRRAALIHDGDRDPLDVMLRRTEALLDDVRRMSGAPNLEAPAAELAGLRARSEATDASDVAARRANFDLVCRVRRRIAFSNPLLDFRELLFLKRHLSTYGHMCDQYYGITQRPGGGLFVLSDPFGDRPVERDVLAGAKVESGRLRGRVLDATGSFLSPDLSFDGKTVAFAYVELRGVSGHQANNSPAIGPWPVERSYHVFTVGVDGSRLTQLTDGTWNDFDPCFMPGGRIAFISERRGGYLRCGRTCPTYTLFDMGSDGGDIRCLSYHETNEWHPSVTHDGMILWTRWDYVDRHGCTTHMPWITSPDGRDPRPVHGNYAPRNLRADMEVELRAIPGSRKFVATAAPHHGQSFGSLVILDPDVKDDDGPAPFRRLTPDCGFPESQKGAQAYSQAWPLSETYHLCVYSPTSAGVAKGARKQAPGAPAGRPPALPYGIYLLDAFGNKELIYRDPDIAVHNPVPLRPRPVPPVVAEASRPVSITNDAPAEATVSVINVYESLKPWPENTRVAALRIVQVFPLSMPCAAGPLETGPRIPQAGDSVNLARGVLGTVPVEEDGSAHFLVPARKEIFFQALDARGLALQSMRSGTHLQPGERQTCIGCHEPKHASPRPSRVPLALLRPPSRLQPDVDGTYPLHYPRLVQPVLDRNCVGCHARNADKKAPRLDGQALGDPANPAASRKAVYVRSYTESYRSLLPYAYYSYGDGYRTTPGRFGALGSRLYPLLEKGHHDVKLSADDRHRLAVWLDMCSLFYGVYDIRAGEVVLKGGNAFPTLE